MNGQRPPWDPDPRYVQPPEPVRPDPADFRPTLTVPLLLAIAVVVVAVLVLMAAAAPRPAALPVSPPDAQPTGAPLGNGRVFGGTPPSPEPVRADAAASGSDVSAAAVPLAEIYRGTATWYCSDGRDGSRRSACTRGYGPSDLVAAIDRKDSEFRKGDLVLVRYRDQFVVVRIVDTCACVDARVIDLTIGAFQQLAPWGYGVIPVTLEDADALRLPETEAAP